VNHYNHEKITDIISGFHVPVRPELLDTIQSLMEQAEPDIDEIAKKISEDVGLSASILKIINSPFYGCKREVTAIKQAVMRLGLKVIDSLVTALLLKTSFKGEASISLERFWEEATDIANAMTFIGNHLGVKTPTEILYTVGLFHNCGIPLLALKYDDYDKVLVEAHQKNTNSLSSESETYRTNHAVLGYFVASSWRLPPYICKLISQHHDLEYLKTRNETENHLIFAVLKMAENLVDKMKRFNSSPDWQYIQSDIFNLFGLTDSDYKQLEDDYFDVFQ